MHAGLSSYLWIIAIYMCEEAADALLSKLIASAWTAKLLLEPWPIQPSIGLWEAVGERKSHPQLQGAISKSIDTKLDGILVSIVLQ